MNMTILAEIGEWAAYGFFEGTDMPYPRRWGLALRRMYEHMLLSSWQELMNRFAYIETNFPGLLGFFVPDSGAEMPEEDTTFRRMLRYLNARYIEQILLKDVADYFHININHAGSLLKKNTGLTYSEYLNKIRLDRSKELLATATLPITEVAEQPGYRDYFYFSKLFKKICHVPPVNTGNRQTVWQMSPA